MRQSFFMLSLQCDLNFLNPCCSFFATAYVESCYKVAYLEKIAKNPCYRLAARILWSINWATSVIGSDMELADGQIHLLRKLSESPTGGGDLFHAGRLLLGSCGDVLRLTGRFLGGNIDFFN